MSKSNVPPSPLAVWGWDDGWAKTWSASSPRDAWRPGRVTAERREEYRLATEDGERSARVPGRFRHRAATRIDYPAVGDWVAWEKDSDSEVARIRSVLSRRNRFSRKASGIEAVEQILATNIDFAMIVGGLDDNFNPARIDRMIVSVLDVGARPIVVLTKADLVADPAPFVARVASEVPILAVSATTGAGIAELLRLLPPARTAVLLGSSGAGKSTLANALLGEEVQETMEVREKDSKGRHATSHRQLFPLPSGALLLDSPGIREFALWMETGGLDARFDEIVALAASCRFRDCRHESEPGCAVRAAVADGRLAPERIERYEKMKREQAALARRAEAHAARTKKRGRT